MRARLTHAAFDDLFEIHAHVLEQAGVVTAESVLAELEGRWHELPLRREADTSAVIWRMTTLDSYRFTHILSRMSSARMK